MRTNPTSCEATLSRPRPARLLHDRSTQRLFCAEAGKSLPGATRGDVVRSMAPHALRPAKATTEPSATQPAVAGRGPQGWPLGELPKEGAAAARAPRQSKAESRAARSRVWPEPTSANGWRWPQRLSRSSAPAGACSGNVASTKRTALEAGLPAQARQPAAPFMLPPISAERPAHKAGRAASFWRQLGREADGGGGSGPPRTTTPGRQCGPEFQMALRVPRSPSLEGDARWA